MGSSQDLSPSATAATPKSAATDAGHPCVYGAGIDPYSGGHARILIDGDAYSPRFIASAPSLLSALIFAVEILEEADARLGYAPGSLGQIEMDQAIADGYAAIAKATRQEVTASGDELAREGSASGMNPEKGAARKPLAVGDKVRAAAGDVLEVVALKRKSPTCGEEYAVWDEDSGYSAVPASDVESWERVQ